MCCLTGWSQMWAQSSGVGGSGSWKSSCMLVNLSVTTHDMHACLCWDPIPRMPAYFYLFLSITWLRTNMFWSTKIVIAKITLSSACGFSFGVACRWWLLSLFWRIWVFHLGKPGVVVTRSWQLQEDSEVKFDWHCFILRDSFQKVK